MFLTDGQLVSDLADTLQKDVGDLQPYWSRIVSQEHVKAYNWMVAALLKRGFLIAQITAWDLGPFYERDLTLWGALRRSAALQAVDDRLLETMDVRKEIMELECLAIGGVFQDPQGTAGQVGVGDLSTNTDIFTLPPSGGSQFPDDFPGPGRGRETRF